MLAGEHSWVQGAGRAPTPHKPFQHRTGRSRLVSTHGPHTLVLRSEGAQVTIGIPDRPVDQRGPTQGLGWAGQGHGVQGAMGQGRGGRASLCGEGPPADLNFKWLCPLPLLLLPPHPLPAFCGQDPGQRALPAHQVSVTKEAAPEVGQMVQ